METSRFSIRNAYLNEVPLPATEYNRLLHIDDMSTAAAANANAHAILLGIIASHGLEDIFSLHLVPSISTSPMAVPRTPGRYPNLRGLYFKACADGRTMTAYEYTTEPGADLSAHEDFVKKFASMTIKLGVEDIFALTAHSLCPENSTLTEFEVVHILSTILVAGATLLPAQDIVASTSKDWTPTPDYIEYAGGDAPGHRPAEVHATHVGQTL
ncbi:hypothetical protein BDW74DRAFT_179743 [Aspergillus multicolor]|uniref:uncharacterized protein n=1 Tax=Aspergillus multicolor TaxID=41759 RepID=UPI003CCE2DBC